MASFDVAELQRMLANIIRVGVIEELDAANARVKVNVSGLVTDWLPWGTDAAGRVRKWSPKQVGEQVLLFSPYGDPSQAIVGPSIYQEQFPANDNNMGRETTTFADGTTVSYDQKAGAMTINVAGAGLVNVQCKTATVKATDQVTLDTPNVHCTGNIKADGEVSDKVRAMSADRAIYNGHTHPNNAASPPNQKQ